jgi:hypothetical protein
VTIWRWSRLGSNQRPPACEAGALPLSYETGAAGETTSKISTRGPIGRTCCPRLNNGARVGAEEFVRSRSGGLSSCFAPGDDLVRCARM